ncbi:hypothetical protein [Exiguobacterium sp. s26]|uniref:hypothetical protein n=1 Tax=Exiguobacterium sp. s26 TaxID=2751231 RepID=UPI001BE91E0F|nr:hypothetical protein [Exiguobacterium sp. s26]
MKLTLTRHAITRFKERITNEDNEDFIRDFVSSELTVAVHLYSCNGRDYYHSAGITFVLADRCLVTLFLATT